MPSSLTPFDGPPQAAMQPAAGTAPLQQWPGWAEEPEERGVPWGRYWAAIKRYKWLILGILTAGTAVGVVLSRFYTPVYTATASVWVAGSDRRSGGTRITGPIQPADDPSTPNWAELIQSRAVLETIVRRLDLYVIPDRPGDSLALSGLDIGPGFRPGRYVLAVGPDGTRYTLTAATTGQLVERGTVGDSVGRSVGLLWAPPASALRPGSQTSFTVISPAAATAQLAAGIDVRPSPRGGAIRVSLTGLEPRRTAATMNAVLREFVNFSTELKRRNYSEQVQTLQNQLALAEGDLRSKEESYRNFRITAITQPSEGTAISPGTPETQGPVLGSYFDQKMRLESLRNDRQTLERLLQQSRTGSAPLDAYYAIPSVANGARELRSALDRLTTKEDSLRRLRLTYTDQYRGVTELQRQVNELRTQVIPSLTRSYIAQLQTQESDLASRVSQMTQELRGIPGRETQDARLQRDVNVAGNLYTQLKQAYANAKVAELSTTPDIAIIDSAVTPFLPSNSNSWARLLILAVAASLAGGVGLALLLDHIDTRFRYPEQVSDELGLPVLGAVPQIHKQKSGEPDPEEAAQVIEAFRSIRLGLANSFSSGGPVVFTVTSPGAGDGKSLVSANLALSFAEAGYRTLLVDGDIRRGELHAMFGASRRPGLVDFLVGDVPLEAVLRESGHENLSLIPCGTRRHRGPELLISEALARLVADMRLRYDAIVMDSPPLGAGVDPYVLGTATGNMLLVFRTGTSDRKMAEAKLKLVERLPIRILGAVLNDVQSTGAYRYYTYLYGYTASDEDAPRLESKVGELTRA